MWQVTNALEQELAVEGVPGRWRRREVASYGWRRFQINYRNATVTILQITLNFSTEVENL
jgi:hypothetical protein